MKSFKEKTERIPPGVKSSVVYTLATLFTRGLAIVTVPVFTRIMTTEEIGLVNLYNSWYAMISVVATLSLTSGGFQVMMKEYPDRRRQYLSSVTTLTSVMALLLAVVYTFAPSFWNEITGLPTELMLLMLAGFLTAPARDFWLAQQRYEYRYKLAGILSFGQAIVATALSVLIVLHLRGTGYAAEGRLFANYAVLYGVAFAIWIVLLVRGKTFFDREFWGKSLRLSLPLIGYSIAAQVLSVSDRTMIGSMVGNDAVGIYGTLYSVGTICTLFWSALNASFLPYLFENIGKEENKIKRISSLMLAVYAVIAVLITYLAPEIVRILATEEYYEGIYIMPPIAAGVFLMAVTNMYSNIAVYYKKTVLVMIPAVIAAVSNVVLNYIFIPRYGYMAAAYTTLVAYVLLAALQALFALIVQRRKGEKIYGNWSILLLSVVTVGLDLAGLVLYRNSVARYCAVAAGIAAAALLCWLYVKKRRQHRVRDPREPQ